MDLRWLILLFIVPGLAGLVYVSPGIGILTLIGGLVLLEFIVVRESSDGTADRIAASQKQAASDENLSELLESFRHDTRV